MIERIDEDKKTGDNKINIACKCYPERILNTEIGSFKNSLPVLNKTSSVWHRKDKGIPKYSIHKMKMERLQDHLN